MYNRLMEKLEQTTAIKWFPGRGVEENWIKEDDNIKSCLDSFSYRGNFKLLWGQFLLYM